MKTQPTISPVFHAIPTAARPATSSDAEGFVALDGAELYRVPHVDRIPPFLMTLSSESDLWMFISSTGGLTAGRVSADRAAFPYETEDRLHRMHGVTGPITLLRVTPDRRSTVLWEPFSPSAPRDEVERHLYRDALGSRVVFEETRRDLGMTFRYQWAATDRLGFVRTATLVNHGTAPSRVELLDGLLNLLPAGLTMALQRSYSCLVDAYKQSEIDVPLSMALYSLTSLVTDRAEPREALRATTAWTTGLPEAAVSLSEDAVAQFRFGQPVSLREVSSGRRGAFLCLANLDLPPAAEQAWNIVVDVERSQVQIAQARSLLSLPSAVPPAIAEAMAETEAGLRRNIAACDGLQSTRERASDAHHGLNVLLNNMRGGVPLDHYAVSGPAFAAFVRDRNVPVSTAHDPLLSRLPDTLTLARLRELAASAADADLFRLALEYVPLTFGRRHGDPSRPWNQFSINLRNAHGDRRVGYQGNWRDIFQNWEALSLSYPELLDSFIAKFVNASTVDGFNPYRVTSEGIEWEEEDEADPWSNIGYWGDHQIVYLLRLLELSRDHHPGRLESLLARPLFAYANVPYRFRPHAEVSADPHRSIEFDRARSRTVAERVTSIGADGRLVLAPNGRVRHVTLAEKLLVPLLSKICNLVPSGGVWLNSQRPEWNDANNAIAGWGLSVVTVGYMRRFVSLLREMLTSTSGKSDTLPITPEVRRWIADVSAALAGFPANETSGPARRALLDALGRAFENHRARAYEIGLFPPEPVPTSEVLELLRRADDVITATLRASRRSDGLYHAYNVLSLGSPEGLRVSHLSEMLEGQVSILSSGLLDARETAALIDRLFAGKLYRPDIQSFILYPHATLPRFLDRNVVPADAARANPLLAALLAAGDRSLLERDASGTHRFAPDLSNARELSAHLDRLARSERFGKLASAHRQATLDLYERVFSHASFTGRSGTMHAYEGLGSVYWHMVGKLLIAIQERFWAHVDAAGPAELSDALASRYYRVRAGLGLSKTSAAFGAVPIEPYSHSPFGGGARQPGMTGQVKEEVLARRGELGARVRAGEIHFTPLLLRRRELHGAPASFHCVHPDGTPAGVHLPPRSCAFTFCQIPVVYRFDAVAPSISVHRRGHPPERVHGSSLGRRTSAQIFARESDIDHLVVAFPPSALRND
jgi:hypothetical protein